ncbi:MAG: hypothetical protein WC044_12700 [Crocinitomicaceae bacterium]
MTKKSIQFILVGFVFLSSCTIPGKISGIYKTRTNKTSDIQRSSITAYPLIVDLNVDLTTRVSGSSAGELINGLTEEYFRELALSEAMVKSGADILVEPVYTVTKNFTGVGTQIRTNIEVVVTGYVGKYKNARNLSPSDTSMVQFVSGNKIMESAVPKSSTLQLVSSPTKIY